MYVYICIWVCVHVDGVMYDFIQKQMKMAATLEEFPTSPSFSMRDNAHFPRSVSTKETPISDPPCLPPRLSATTAASLSLSLHQYSQPTTPRISFSPEYSSKMDTACAGTYRCVSSVLKKDGQILCIASANGMVYTGSQGNAVRVWKLPEFTECAQLKTKASMVVAMQVSNDRVYAAYADCRIRVWRRTWEGVIRHVRMATVPTAGSYVRSYIIGGNKMIKHMGPISSLAINVTDDVLYSASVDKTVKVWRISDFKCIETIQAHLEPINAIVVADDGVLYTASDDATVRVWRRNFCSGDRPHSLTVTLPAKHSPVKTLALSSDGRVLYGGCSDGYVHYWLKGWFTGQLQYGGALSGHTHAVMCLSSAATYVVSGSADSTCRVWIRELDGQHSSVALLQGHRGPVRCVTVLSGHVMDENAEDGCTVCSGSLDGVLKVWRVHHATSPSTRDALQNACEYFELT
ncbi:protein JINGUBANG-like [Primulina tabacum]|uniref:protein JINGUBANG-like n=1 Tax=Primulina tabacum TaxID=48773 RepID=UPI003F59C63B